MRLVIDVGNTETVMGVVARDELDLRAHWRVSTQVPRTADEYIHLLRSLLADGGYDRKRLDVAVLGSVVPASTQVLTVALSQLVRGEVMVVTPDSPLPITLDVDEPRTVGADRIVNTLAARELYARDTIAVDLGTATTFDLISAEGVFVGGAIAPGVSSGLEWLARRTAKLPTVELKPPASAVGRNTEDCVRSGIFYAAVDAIDGMVERLRTEWACEDPYVVVTGGFASVMGPHCRSVDHIEPFLTLYGLALAGEVLGGA